MQLEMIECGECGAPAEVIRRYKLPSTGGPVLHTKYRCVNLHVRIEPRI